jgi:NitT/TauT family transport system permease protein
MKRFVTPNAVLTPGTMKIMIVTQVIFALLVWTFVPFPLLPKPTEIATAWMRLMGEGFLVDLIASFRITVEAILITSAISLALVYLTVLPVVRPLVSLISKFRFNGLVGLTLFFTLLTSGGHELKLALLVFGMTVWFVTSMAAVITAIPKEEFDHARTLGMSEWRVVLEVVVLGKADEALEVVRQNAAIGWMMLSMVEGIVRSEGGVGSMLISQSKYLHLDAVFAIQITILVVGIGIDYLLGAMKRILLPYSEIGKERK